MELEVGDALTRYFNYDGVRITTVNTYTRIESTESGVRLHVASSQGELKIDAVKVLVATGRNPNTDSLNLSAAGVEPHVNHGVKIDAHMQTTRVGVYAAGDVTGEDQFVYMAACGAKLAATNAMNSDSLAYDNTAMPAVFFTDPQVASVGLTEAGAMAVGYEVRTSILTLDHVPRALMLQRFPFVPVESVSWIRNCDFKSGCR